MLVRLGAGLGLSVGVCACGLGESTRMRRCATWCWGLILLLLAGAGRVLGNASDGLKPGQLFAWQALFNATGGRDGRWTCCSNSYNDPCGCDDGQWQGVACNQTTGMITFVALMGCHLAGPLPTILSEWTELTVLDLDTNELTGILPKEWQTMTL